MRKTTAKKTRPVVSESDINDILLLREEVAKLRKQAREAEARLAQQETSVMMILKLGGVCEGPRQVAIELVTGPCRPKYQEMWVLHMAEYHGITEAMAIEVAKSKYPPKQTECLVIGEPSVVN